MTNLRHVIEIESVTDIRWADVGDILSVLVQQLKRDSDGDLWNVIDHNYHGNVRGAQDSNRGLRAHWYVDAAKPDEQTRS